MGGGVAIDPGKHTANIKFNIDLKSLECMCKTLKDFCFKTTVDESVGINGKTQCDINFNLNYKNKWKCGGWTISTSAGAKYDCDTKQFTGDIRLDVER